MGVGSYGNDFHGRGGTFNIDGPLGGEEAYEAYLKDCKSDGEDDPQTQEEYEQQVYDEENDLLISSAAEAVKPIGFGVANDRADFDRDFVSIADNGLVEVGWRSWEHDWVIGVGPTRRAGEILDFDEMQMLEETGRTIDGFKADYDALAADTLELVRMAVQENGMDCSFKSGSYMSTRYPRAEDPEPRIAELQASIKAMSEKLETGREDTLGLVSSDERAALIRTAVEHGVKFTFPVVDRGENCLLLYNGADEDDNGCEVFASMTITPEMRPLVAALPATGHFPLPRNEATEAWFKARQANPREDNLIVSAEEIAAATGTDVSIKIFPDDTDPTLTTQVMMAHAPASPTPSL